MRRVRVGVVGAGLIGQVEHIPNLAALPERFELAGVADPSSAVRAAVEARYGVPVHESAARLFDDPSIDGVVIAVPDPLHAGLVLQALAGGKHVLCEKPLCYTARDVAEIAAARDQAGRVVQVGYMKRFDPSYEAALELVPTDGAGFLSMSAHVIDPDAWAFVAHRPFVRPTDLDPGLGAALARSRADQVAEAVGAPLTDGLLVGYTDTLMGGLVHIVNAGHGLLDRMGIPDGEVVDGQIFGGGAGAAGTVRLLGGQALWRFQQVWVPHVAQYEERVTMVFDDRVIELIFPAPYLNHFPTRLTVQSAEGHRYETREIRNGFQEAFVRELEAWWEAIVEGKPVRNTVEAAGRDIRVLCEVGRLAAGVR